MQQQPMTVNATHAAQAPVQQAQVVSVRTANGQIVQVSKVLKVKDRQKNIGWISISKFSKIKYSVSLS